MKISRTEVVAINFFAIRWIFIFATTWKMKSRRLGWWV